MRTFTLCLLVLFAVAVRVDAAQKPNVLFVLIDDMGYGDLGCFGGMRAQTEAIDRLAKEGLRFTQFYVNSPICSPSRVAFTTGQYPTRWRVTSFLASGREDRERGIADWLDPAAPSLARFLQQAGYHTAHVGKWHMGGQRDVGDAPLISEYGFNTSVTNFEGLGERILPIFANDLNHGPTRMSAQLGGEIKWVDREKVTEAFVDRAIAEIDNAKKQDKPFYINLWPDDVHSPMQAPKDLRGDNSPADNYLGVLAEMDRQLGRIFDHIRKDETLHDNTIILLCSDNGHEQGLGSSGGLRGSKGQLYEGGIRSPLVVWAPGLIAKQKFGSSNDTTVIAGMDFAPTLLAIAKVEAPSQVSFDGMDMSDAILGRSAAARRKPVIWVRPPDRPGPPDNNLPDLAIRRGAHKLLVDGDGSNPQLYDIMNDPNETTNLADKRPDLAERYTAEAIELAEKTAPPAR